ncbi:BgTH12-00583 [Blumeria graminis f. sp. triticale]|uniref:BgTH12-00583 n=1 Tax=Blumeria graminis f. sp. triticale TaxID=1689686 RepID=A0A9W4GIN5_BLUGR|nr:BgTH12-00583 [Blumeria graminis f. sp. triticale]
MPSAIPTGEVHTCLRPGAPVNSYIWALFGLAKKHY